MKSLTSLALISLFAIAACGGPDPEPQQPEEPATGTAEPAGEAGVEDEAGDDSD